MRWDSRCVLRSSTKPLGGALLFSCITDYDTEDDSGISMAFVVSFSAVFDCSSVGFCFVFVWFLHCSSESSSGIITRRKKPTGMGIGLALVVKSIAMELEGYPHQRFWVFLVL